MRSFKTALYLLSVLATCGAMLPASAQSYLDPKPEKHSYDDRFRLEVDALYGSYSTQIRLDRVVTVAGATVITPGTVITAEDDLGLAKKQFVGQVELTLLPGQHHLVRFNGLSMRRDGDTILKRTITWETDTFNASEHVVSHLDISMFGLTYGYLPFRTDRYELGISIGVQLATVSANAEVPTRTVRASESAAGPVPLLGLEGRFDLTRRLSVDVRWQYLSVGWAETFGADLNGATATITDGKFSLRWRQSQHFSYGIAYRLFKLDAAAPNSSTSGAVNLSYAGPALFLQASM